MNMGVAFDAMPAPMLLVIKKGNMSAHIILNIILRNGYCSVCFCFFESTGDADGRPRFDMSYVGSLPAEVNPVATCY